MHPVFIFLNVKPFDFIDLLTLIDFLQVYFQLILIHTIFPE